MTDGQSARAQLAADRIAIASGTARLNELPVERRLRVIVENDGEGQ